ncbi:hypothetical protein SDC9_204201 [bioreactor metagenome]|uniref:Uncharacterized protein n=1 Tax=bioreactor metagenome TaxID=1076179 RepID=A0A645IYV1_9ZZZZ
MHIISRGISTPMDTPIAIRLPDIPTAIPTAARTKALNPIPKYPIIIIMILDILPAGDFATGARSGRSTTCVSVSVSSSSSILAFVSYHTAFPLCTPFFTSSSALFTVLLIFLLSCLKSVEFMASFTMDLISSPRLE